ncbi:hypothetical protein FOQG_00503 [Fusarium oxysporum f. sp. raphani 54005]|uniref:Uncharacterized protein n=3 Tax=Fusarium oxysporum TaxID=5507 RepID=X0E1T3_FUSOX|nr:hypothetical protein FOVG_03074 [Fusarium oxysporum f. sp. pisi HDV247]EXL00273.1 hypothetical protein FOQG_00503 [Fusarium oxysporum f. sp. raphani 54005]EXL77752.1 hypothetical protein FOPG_07894 [Fusarium oxysporum f. sp. conglutinans race 2 54008]
MHIINNTQVQQAFSVFNPEHNPDFPIHTGWYKVELTSNSFSSSRRPYCRSGDYHFPATKNPESPPNFKRKGFTT